MSTRQRKNINLIYLTKILNASTNYFIISTAMSTDDKINNFKYDLLLLDLFCVRLKNSFYNVLQQKKILDFYGKISGVHYIIFNFNSYFIKERQLVELFQKYQNEIFFTIGRINSTIYDTWRLHRNFFDSDKGNTQLRFITDVLQPSKVLLPSVLRYPFLNILYLCQLMLRRI